jgi:hypothetical protein
VERRILELHYRLTGCELGYYNPKTKKFREGLESEGSYQSNLEIVRTALKKGKTASDLEEFIRQRYNAGERAVSLADLLPKAEARHMDEQDNLLEEGLIYQHPALYRRISPSFVVSGDTMIQSTPGRLEPLLHFTLRDLVLYYADRLRQGACSPRQFVSALGACRYLLQDARVDELLHAVDLAAERSQETGKEYTALQLGDFLPEARLEVRMRTARAGER